MQCCHTSYDEAEGTSLRWRRQPVFLLFDQMRRRKHLKVQKAVYLGTLQLE